MDQLVGYDTTIPQFRPNRFSPILAKNVRRFYAQGSLDDANQFHRLQFKIRKADPTIVYENIRLCLPLRLSMTNHIGDNISMRIEHSQPGCNIAVSANPITAFKTIQLALNGKIYTSDDRFHGLLDKCYQRKGEQLF